jgi:hypothetical protein
LTGTPSAPLAGIVEITGGRAGARISQVEPCTAPEAAVIVVLPAINPLATPPEVIVATEGTDELQVTEEVKFWVLPSL